MSVNSTDPSVSDICSSYKDNQPVYITFIVTRYIFITPLSIFILYLSVQQQRRSVKAASHSDIFTYHQSVLELIWSLGTIFYMSGVSLDLSSLAKVGVLFVSTCFFGETFFHILTCAERYLAVVHPVTYRGLQNTHGSTIRNFCLICAWSLSWVWGYISYSFYPITPFIASLCLLLSSLVIVSFFSLCVLHSLVHPGPGEGGRNRGKTKQRAFVTVKAIMGVQLLWFLGYAVVLAITKTKTSSNSFSCLIAIIVLWFSIPSSLVLPLLYLHKHCKRPCGRPSRVKTRQVD